MGEWILVIAAIGTGLASLYCLIVVTIKLYQEKGLLSALFGFLCCALYPYFWGWMNSGRLRLTDLMIFWSVMTVLNIIMQITSQVMFGSMTDFSPLIEAGF